MSENDIKLEPNELAFIALTNEYCQTIEKAAEGIDRDTFVKTMTKLLPRIYISANDIDMNPMANVYIDSALDETAYEQIRDTISQVMADEDIYLEVFLDDMKYSDTPISASISENLADLYQEFYNLVNAVQYATTSDQSDLLGLCYENFTDYWGQTLVNVLRALHNVRYTAIYNNDF
ncbi:MAG: DUF5063 domain-containing protein [Muribaculaceae bacterium]|nr:DUF5063 domain-containing protein [Muribaculaceae bacterium]